MNTHADMSENQLCALWVRAGAALLLALIVAVTSCNMQAQSLAAKALEKGVDPVGVSCVYTTSTNCPLAAMRPARAEH